MDKCSATWGFKTLNLVKKVVLGLYICGIYSNVVFAAPADYDQQQQAKRQEKQQKEQIDAPKVKLQKKQKDSGEVFFPKEPFRF
jgi:hemolysin activation/secretion protein